MSSERVGYRSGEARRVLARPVPLATASRPPAEAPPPGLGIVDRAVNGTCVVTVTGEIDGETAAHLRTAVTTAIDSTSGDACVLDLTQVGFLDSAGLAALLAANTHADAHRKPLRIVVDSNSPVIRPIEVTGLDVVLRLYHTVGEALDAGNRTDHAVRRPDA
ncbi:STAS domain-containing protein [Amycolatopsis sp. NBC_01307]|uniref:STAS domain-containing protein n=1 Tax=Amycolatopsis sp. NBC_01307 TaxID=2903561 RepID=UPI002E15AE4F|nr:STAS domain-containing protein [Amycolatopsis sp. NBC_01307]